MEKIKGKYFVPNQGSLQPLPKVPLWEEAGGESKEDSSTDNRKLDITLDAGTLEEIKGREGLW